MPRHHTPALILAAALLLPLGALAADATPPQPSEAAQETRKDADTRAADAKPRKKAAMACEGATASRIRRNKAGECVHSAQPTRSYSKEDIDTTGQTDMGEALKRLDPRFH